MKPLQTHGLTVERWVFPHDRFVAYDESDVAWAKPLRFGHAEHDPAPYYDVRDENGDLIGYTKNDPTKHEGRDLMLAVVNEPVHLWEPEPHRPTQTEFRTIRVEKSWFRCNRQDFETWQVMSWDAPLLGQTSFMCLLGRDNRAKWARELMRDNLDKRYLQPR